MALNTKIRGLQIKDADITVTQLANNAVETLKIKDLNVTLGKLETSVQTSLGKADSALQSIAAGSITETELNASVNASLDLADSALQSIAAGSITETELNASVNASLDLADSALQEIPADGVDASKIADDAIGAEHINAGAEVAGYVLTTDAVGGLSWTSKTSISEDYIQEAEIQKVTFAGDDETVEFDVGDSPVANSVQVFLNGMYQNEGSGEDYTLAGSLITFTTAPATGDNLVIHYIVND